jgi:glycerol-3-phosphate dehydrogenase (NAD(P)+)
MTMIAVLGAGAWGTALAVLAARRRHDVRLWVRRPELAMAIEAGRENSQYLPGVKLDDSITVTDDVKRVSGAPMVLSVLPAQHSRTVLAGLAHAIAPDAIVVICSKGIEIESGDLLSDVLADVLPGRTLAILTGPTFADEVSRGQPSAATVACADKDAGASIVAALGNPAFRPYYTDDVIGAQVGGAVKNVLAIACGIAAGRRFGENARAALITRGLAEIGRLCAALGGRQETVMGLSGLGDVALSCTSAQSRNYALGRALGEGGVLSSLMDNRSTVAEGVPSAAAIAALATKHAIDMPIVRAVDAIVHRGGGVDDTIRGLLTRPFRAETEAF